MKRRIVLTGGLALAAVAPVLGETAEPAAPMSVDNFLSRASAAEKVSFHANRLAEALNEQCPGSYLIQIRPGKGVFVGYELEHPYGQEVGAADPLVDAIRAYRQGLIDFCANAPEDNAGCSALADETYVPHLTRLECWNEPAVSRDGAIEALRLALDEDRGVYNSDAADSMVRAALRYLETQT